MNNVIKRVWNTNTMTAIEDLRGAAFTAESGGHTFQIRGENSNGEAVPLSGTVAATFVRADMTTVALSGSASGGVVSLTLSADCYGVPGRFGLTIFLTSGGQKAAIYACVGDVAMSGTGTVAPGVVADVTDLINRINEAIESIPADYTSLLGNIAGNFSVSSAYVAGDVVWYNGNLYRAKQDITQAETWTPAHWDAVKVVTAAITHGQIDAIMARNRQ